MVGAGFLGIIGFLMFADIIPSPWKSQKQENYGTVVVWGTIDKRVFTDAFQDAFPGITTVTLNYTQKDPNTMDNELTEALASGRAPDAVVLSHTALYRHRDRLTPFSVPERDLKNTFIEEAELLIYPNGALGMPIAVDPLVMYWNRDLFSEAGIALPPQSWTAFYLDPVTKLTQRGSTQGSIVQSGIALGQFENVLHAKEILATLILQTGNAITAFTGEGEGITLESALVSRDQTAAAALQFYMRFADPVRPEYSWNRSLPVSRDFFAQGDLATYFGFASERSVITKKNPHLNFDMALLPQAKVKAEDPGRAATFGDLYVVSAVRTAMNPAGAQYLAGLLSGREFSAALAGGLGVAPVRRDMLALRQADPYTDIVYRSALIARGFIDPNPRDTTDAFRAAVEDVLSARRDVTDAINVLDGRLGDSIKRTSL